MGDLEIISFHRENRETSAHALPPAPPIKIDIQTYNQKPKTKKQKTITILYWSGPYSNIDLTPTDKKYRSATNKNHHINKKNYNKYVRKYGYYKT